MSIVERIELDQLESPGTCTAIALTIVPKVHDLGGFCVRRV